MYLLSLSHSGWHKVRAYATATRCDPNDIIAAWITAGTLHDIPASWRHRGDATAMQWLLEAEASVPARVIDDQA
jgi:hypothetical protein